jgi:hypothetical protein
MTDIAPIVTQIAAIQGHINGLSTGQCFDQSPNIIDTHLPVVLNVIKSGRFDRGVGLGLRENWHSVEMQLLVSKDGDLPIAEAIARPFIGRFITAFDRNKTLGNICETSNITAYAYGVVKAYGDPYMGIVFTLEALEMDTGSLFGSAGLYAATVLADSPTAYYRLGETNVADGATLADSSSNAFNATLRNAGATITSVSGGLYGGDTDPALKKSSSAAADGINLPSVAGLSLAGQAISIEFWAKATAPGAFGLIAQKISGANGWIMEANNTGMQFSYDADAHQASYTATSPWDGAWHHIVMTWDGINARFYIDSVLKQTVPLAGTIVAAAVAGKALADDARGSSGFIGSLDELAIYSTVLNQTKITQHYTVGHN